jgi:putative oxidoreductase
LGRGKLQQGVNSVKTKIFYFCRIFLGLAFLVFGLNGFFNFIPPQPMPENAMVFLGGLMGAPYFFPVLKFTEVICGIALLTGFYVPLALLVLAPITLNIFLFHMFLAPTGLMVAFPILGFHLACAWNNWSLYSVFFQPKCDTGCKNETHNHTTWKKTA